MEGRLGLAVQGRLAVAGADRLVVAEPVQAETRKHFPPTAAGSLCAAPEALPGQALAAAAWPGAPYK